MEGLEDFASTLEQAFQQYRKLWEKYIKLKEIHEQCNTNFKETPPKNQVVKHERQQERRNLFDISNTSPKIKEHVPQYFRGKFKPGEIGQHCWECKTYYDNLPLPRGKLQKRKNLISRHRHRYARPRSPQGLWNPEFSDTDDDNCENRGRKQDGCKG